ncbi:hypothetical protein PO878_10725 [Iamia majanohamensis]|uniref:Uncharacterized protein n=1 Tax=Iamia majanohamensis TaxID=467976 RepID=A0AAE9YB50_9ACTN|nr:hypothetical protein [Iamia majanohamensis]WCO69196.1 hypothetical protein PO878_10725 [Iamia majanohamensis]
MAKGRGESEDDRSPVEGATEVWHLVRDYAKQETVEPLKGLVSYLKWGLIGSLLLAIGITELVVALLRAVQSEGASVFDGRWSFVPYIITLVVATVVLLLAKRAITSGRSET